MGLPFHLIPCFQMIFFYVKVIRASKDQLQSLLIPEHPAAFCCPWEFTPCGLQATWSLAESLFLINKTTTIWNPWKSVCHVCGSTQPVWLVSAPSRQLVLSESLSDIFTISISLGRGGVSEFGQLQGRFEAVELSTSWVLRCFRLGCISWWKALYNSGTSQWVLGYPHDLASIFVVLLALC